MQNFNIVRETKKHWWQSQLYHVPAQNKEEALEKVIALIQSGEIDQNPESWPTNIDIVSMNENPDTISIAENNGESTEILLYGGDNPSDEPEWSNGIQDRKKEKYHLNIIDSEGEYQCIHLYHVDCFEVLSKAAEQLAKGNSIFSILKID